MAVTIRAVERPNGSGGSKEPTLPEAIAFDCYRTLFDNSHGDWKLTFGEIIEAQGLPLDSEEFWTRWRKYEVNFRKIRTDLGRPYNSPRSSRTGRPGLNASRTYLTISVLGLSPGPTPWRPVTALRCT